MRTNLLIPMLALISLSGCAHRATAPEHMDGEYASERRGLSLELKTDGTFEASVAHWSSSMGCMLVIEGEAVGEWRVDVDKIAFFNVQSTGELIDSFSGARIDDGGSVLVLPSPFEIDGERLQRQGQPNYLLPER